ncbi:hypothetical protein, partial [Shigella flexneri]|uniref:hypothetical protein n=2 Tax=Shigella TaxID=620 RepID=UPI00100866A8
MAMIDPRTPEGRLTLRYRGLPTSILLAMLGVDKEATNDRPFYSWICPYISRHLLSLNPLQARCRR